MAGPGHGYAGGIGIVALLLALLVGCDPSGQRDGEAGRPDEAAVAAMVLSATQPISIGGQDEREDYYIGHAVGALRLSDGRIVVGDGMTRQLRLYDRSGRHTRTFGGTGGGPGEFEMLHSVTRMAGDSIVGWDAAQRRAPVFTPDGEPAYTISNPAWSAALAEMQKTSPRHLLLPITLHQLTNDHLLIQLTAEPIVSVTAATQILQDTTPLLVLDRHGENWVALGEFPGIELFYHDRTIESA